MSGRNGRAVSVRKTEAIVSYHYTNKASIPDTFVIEAVLFLSRFCAGAPGCKSSGEPYLKRCAHSNADPRRCVACFIVI